MVENPTYDDALRSIVNRPFLASSEWQRQQWRANRTTAHERIVEFERVFVARLAKLGVPAYCHCMIRTAAEQQALYDLGKSKDSPADGLWPHRRHAIDVVHSVKHWNMTRKEFAIFGHVGKEVAAALGIKVTWGGDWNFYDPAHWELQGWKKL